MPGGVRSPDLSRRNTDVKHPFRVTLINKKFLDHGVKFNGVDSAGVLKLFAPHRHTKLFLYSERAFQDTVEPQTRYICEIAVQIAIEVVGTDYGFT